MDDGPTHDVVSTKYFVKASNILHYTQIPIQTKNGSANYLQYAILYQIAICALLNQIK